MYALPSRYCQSDMLVRMANDEFGELSPGGGRVQSIADWVRRHVEYRYGTTDAMTSAFDTATERVGVCRDFAHLVIAFCRALDIPARYVSGYALGLEPPDFHGYVQVYLGGAWHNVDATCDEVRPALVPIAHGRDAADVAMTTSWVNNTILEQIRGSPGGQGLRRVCLLGGGFSSKLAQFAFELHVGRGLNSLLPQGEKACSQQPILMICVQPDCKPRELRDSQAEEGRNLASLMERPVPTV